MTNELYFIAVVIFVVVVAGFVSSSKINRKSKDKYSIISLYNLLIDQFVSIYESIADLYNKKSKLAEKYNNQDYKKRGQV